MRWTRRGLLFQPDGTALWARSHASTPFVMTRPDGRTDVYFTSRSADGRSHIGVAALTPDPENGFVVGQPELVLEPGAVGLFDEAGVAMGSILEEDGHEYLFYMGWSLRVTVPWQNSIGVAVRQAGESTFRKLSRVPVLDRSEIDPYSMSYPWVLNEPDGWTAWYGTNRSWGAHPTDMDHVIRRARGGSGRTWVRDATPAIDHQSSDEYAVARPCVRKTRQGFEMYYSRRTLSAPETYEIGFATSDDGEQWVRRDAEVSFDGPIGSWEADMSCYPCVFEHDGATMMLYNGNGFGATGFGLAICDDDA